MKKKLLLSFAAFFIVSVCLSAQQQQQQPFRRYLKVFQDPVEYRERIRFGVKLGGQISVISKIHAGSNYRIPGLTIGGAMLMPLQEKDYCQFFFAPELLYSQGGEKGNGNDGSRDVKFYMDYIDLPLMFKLYLINDNLLFVEFGPKPSLRVNYKNRSKDLSKPEKFDFGLCLGGGVSLGFDNNYEIGARLNYGLMDIYPDTKKNNLNISGAVAFTYIF